MKTLLIILVASFISTAAYAKYDPKDVCYKIAVPEAQIDAKIQACEAKGGTWTTVQVVASSGETVTTTTKRHTAECLVDIKCSK